MLNLTGPRWPQDIHQTVHVNVRQNPGCCQVILWLALALFALSLCSALSNVG